MSADHVELSFVGATSMEAGILAGDLDGFIRERTEADSEVRRADPTAQDFGATLAIILGTASVRALAQAIGVWVQRHREAQARLKIGDVEVELTNVDTKTLHAVLEEAIEAARR